MFDIGNRVGSAALIAAFVMVDTAVISAGGVWLDGTELRNRFDDATLDGRYATGRPFTERYGRDGRVRYTERGVTLGGHWSITAGTLCTIYDGDDSGGCYRVVRVAPNCYEFYFVSRTEETAPGTTGGKPKWTARGALQGQPNACSDEPSV